MNSNWTLSVKLGFVIRVNKSKNPKTSRVETKLVFYIFNNTNNNNNKFILKNIKSLSMKLLSPHKKFNYRIAKNEKKREKEKEKKNKFPIILIVE